MSEIQMIEPKKFLKLDLGCGAQKKPGFVGVDIRPELNPDVCVDLRGIGEWPWGPDSIDEVWCSLLLQYFTGPERIAFFNKLYEIMVAGSQATIVVPYGQSNAAFNDPYSCWPPMTEGSFLFLNKGWRDSNKIPYDREITCDFDFGYGFVLQNGWNLKAEEVRNHALVNNWNAAGFLQVVLTKK